MKEEEKEIVSYNYYINILLLLNASYNYHINILLLLNRFIFATRGRVYSTFYELDIIINNSEFVLNIHSYTIALRTGCFSCVLHYT